MFILARKNNDVVEYVVDSTRRYRVFPSKEGLVRFLNGNNSGFGYIESVSNVTCLECGAEITPILIMEDALGACTLCTKCNSSFDMEIDKVFPKENFIIL